MDEDDQTSTVEHRWLKLLIYNNMINMLLRWTIDQKDGQQLHNQKSGVPFDGELKW